MNSTSKFYIILASCRFLQTKLLLVHLWYFIFTVVQKQICKANLKIYEYLLHTAQLSIYCENWQKVKPCNNSITDHKILCTFQWSGRKPSLIKRTFIRCKMGKVRIYWLQVRQCSTVIVLAAARYKVGQFWLVLINWETSALELSWEEGSKFGDKEPRGSFVLAPRRPAAPADISKLLITRF